MKMSDEMIKITNEILDGIIFGTAIFGIGTGIVLLIDLVRSNRYD